MVLAERLQHLMELRNFTQAGLARKVGVSQQTIGKLIRGESRSSVHLHTIAKALHTSIEYLTGEIDDPDNGDVPNDDVALREDIVEISEIDLRYGLGGTFLDQPIEEQKRAFSRSWIRMFTNAKPEELFWTRGQGNSMSPTIEDGEVVLIDRGQTTPAMLDLVWVCALGDFGLIKRLRPMPDGTVKILSDNPHVPPETAADGELHIVGRVVAVLKTI